MDMHKLRSAREGERQYLIRGITDKLMRIEDDFGIETEKDRIGFYWFVFNQIMNYMVVPREIDAYVESPASISQGKSTARHPRFSHLDVGKWIEANIVAIIHDFARVPEEKENLLGLMLEHCQKQLCYIFCGGLLRVEIMTPEMVFMSPEATEGE